VIRVLVIAFLFAFIFVVGTRPLYARPGEKAERHQEKTPPAVAITPGDLDFGDQVTKKASSPQRLTITNTGAQDLYINSVSITEGEKEDFTVVNDRCTGATIASKKSCIIDIKFTPSVTGVRKSSVVILDNAADSPQTVPVRGNGINSVRVRPSE
jgi:hypothetical protein